jgi:hypothetical protein
VAIFFLYVAFIRLVQLVRLSRCGQEQLTIEVVMLGHEVCPDFGGSNMKVLLTRSRGGSFCPTSRDRGDQARRERQAEVSTPRAARCSRVAGGNHPLPLPQIPA